MRIVKNLIKMGKKKIKEAIAYPCVKRTVPLDRKIISASTPVFPDWLANA